MYATATGPDHSYPKLVPSICLLFQQKILQNSYTKVFLILKLYFFHLLLATELFCNDFIIFFLVLKLFKGI